MTEEKRMSAPHTAQNIVQYIKPGTESLVTCHNMHLDTLGLVCAVSHVQIGGMTL